MAIPAGILAQQHSDSTLRIYFNTGKSAATPSETDKLLTALKEMDFTIKSISGFTDSVGSSESNILLSRKRSEYVVHLLQRHFRPGRDFTVTNYGEEHPASHFDNSLNRRVEILLNIQKNPYSVADTGRRQVLKTFTLDKLYFRPDEPVIEPSSIPYLEYISKVLKTIPHGKFEIRGHVNWNETGNAAVDSGYRRKMNELSTARARLVYDILIDKGIPAERMSYKGMGNTQMIYPFAATDEEKRKNMRVEILIVQ
jgi:outer membrane protein OmpA-like peptidoglycan-associated protein